MKTFIGNIIIPALACCLIFLAAPTLGFADSQPWTTAGSTGTVDEADTALVNFNGPTVRVKPSSVPPVTVDIRYNIVAESYLFGGDCIRMAVRYLDNGASAKVIARIKEMDLLTGIVSTKLTFNSNDFSSSVDYQIQTVQTICGTGSFFDFSRKVYYIEVELTKSAAGGDAALQGILISYIKC